MTDREEHEAARGTNGNQMPSGSGRTRDKFQNENSRNTCLKVGDEVVKINSIIAGMGDLGTFKPISARIVSRSR